MTATGTATEATTPWIETRRGTLFFVNSLFVAPASIILFSLGVGALLRTLDASPFLVQAFAVFPTLARYVVPVAGWLLLIPIWSTLRNLATMRERPARIALLVYLSVHLGFLAYAVWFWVTGQSFPAAG